MRVLKAAPTNLRMLRMPSHCIIPLYSNYYVQGADAKHCPLQKVHRYSASSACKPSQLSYAGQIQPVTAGCTRALLVHDPMLHRDTINKRDHRSCQTPKTTQAVT